MSSSEHYLYPSLGVSVAIVGGYPMYRLGLERVFLRIDQHLNVLKVNSVTELMDLEHSCELILFFSLHERMDYISSQKTHDGVIPYTVIISDCIGLSHRLSLELEGRVSVLPLSISLDEADKYLGRLLMERNGSVGYDIIKDVDLQARFLPDFESLTRREKEVMHYLGKGLDNDRIAEKMSIEKNTVKVFIGKIYRKSGVLNRTQAACLFNYFKFSSF